MLRKISELRILKEIIGLSIDGQIDHVHAALDLVFAAMTESERETFTHLLMEYPGFKESLEGPRHGLYDLGALQAYPPNTLAYHYVQFMKKHGYKVEWYEEWDEKTPLHYARNRQYQTHDILHAITGFSGSRLDEVSLQGFYTGQEAPNPTAMVVFTAASLNKLKTSIPKENAEFLRAMAIGFRMGESAQKVLFRNWEDDWGTDIDALREQLGIIPATAHAN